VKKRTTLFLLRQRYLLKSRRETPALAEEVLVWGLQGSPYSSKEILREEEALRLLQTARPKAPVGEPERRQWLEKALQWWDDLQPDLEALAAGRVRRLDQAHRRVRAAAGVRRVTIEPHLPPDWLGVYVLLPGGE
ncbi:MAG: helicase, partial [Chloroflexi bacterium]